MKIVFAGTADFAVPSLQALLDSKHQVVGVYTQPDRPAGRGRRLTMSAVKQLALTYHCQIHQPPDLRSEQAVLELQQLEADVMVVVAYGLILPSSILSVPRLGCLNVHGSLLPRWRGAAPIQRAIMAGDTVSGVTIMQMDEGLDTGAMLTRVETPIALEETSQGLRQRLAKLGADALLVTLSQLEVGMLRPTTQDDALASYASKLTKAEGLIDWSDSAVNLANKVRAFNPWPVAYTMFCGQRLRIWSAECVLNQVSEAPGFLLGATKQGIDIATGDGVLRCLQVQLPGGKILQISDFLNAHRDALVVGKTQFGEL